MTRSKYFANIGKDTRISGNIGMRGFTYRGLIDNDGFIDIFKSFD